MSESQGLSDPRLLRRDVAVQTLLGLITAVLLVAIHPAPVWAFIAIGPLGVAWGVLTYRRLRAEGRMGNRGDVP